MTGFVDVGGGMRGVYSSGIYDRLMDEGIKPEYCIGVSAGAANLITYIAGQRGRTLEFYREYPKRQEYMSFHNLFKTGSYIGLDYIYSDLSNQDGENPLDFESALNSTALFFAPVTRARDGKGIFFPKEEMAVDDYTLLKATSCMPGVCRPVDMKGEAYFDGAIAEPIPVEKAFEDGCDKVVLVLTKPRQEYCNPLLAPKVLAPVLNSYPQVLRKMERLHEKCSEIFEKISEWEKQGKVLVVEPENRHGMKTLTTDKNTVMKMYDQGYCDAGKIIEFI